jgi:hypothetical protein
MHPAIRASYTKTGLRHFKRGFAARMPQLVEAIGDPTLTRLRETSPIGWLPAEVHVSVCEAMVTVVRREDARAIWSDVALEAFDAPMLAPFVSGAARLFGNDPSSIMRMTPQAWQLLYKDCGRAWMDSADASHATMLFEGLPRLITQSAPTLDTFLANCDAAFEHYNCRGTATPGPIDAEQGTFRIDAEWQRISRTSMRPV